jgi:hypothetical protein
MESLTRKTSTILISVGDRTRIFRSVSEIPPSLRRKLLESTSGANSATVLIADEGGRQQIMRSLQGETTGLNSPLLGSLMKRAAIARGGRLNWRHVVEIMLLGGIGLCLWLLAAWK